MTILGQDEFGDRSLLIEYARFDYRVVPKQSSAGESATLMLGRLLSEGARTIGDVRQLNALRESGRSSHRND